ncbi:MAG: hypothetical protein HRT58_06915 [Crocinitomicaceae bacterium]|nr:hypothetical protein [Flavobacteriales bacterium]NQZ35378.1 hypothetical protein [Crocinitomicaceae bacterium]
MSKKKLFLAGTILLLTIVVLQVYSLMNYDHFKAEGGLKLEFSVDHNDVVKKYTRSSLDFDYVMKGAILSHNTNGGDFLAALAKSNKDRLQRPLIRLMNYKEIKELSSSSKDDDVIKFLRNELEANLEETAYFTQLRIKNVLKNSAEVSVDAEELTLISKLTAFNRQIKPKELEMPEVRVGFFEILELQKFYQNWSTLCELMKSDSLPAENNEDWKLTNYDNSTELSQNLSNCVMWKEQGFGLVLDKDKAYVDEMINSDVIDEFFPPTIRFYWSQRAENMEHGEFWMLYAIQIPENGVPVITEKDIRSAEIGANEYGKHVSLKMNQEGSGKWAKMTRENVGRLIAMCVNDVVLSAPNVINPIVDGNTQISGGDLSDLESIVSSINTKHPDLMPTLKFQTIVKGTPPVLNAFVQQLLIAGSFILLLFFSIMLVRNIRAD